MAVFKAKLGSKGQVEISGIDTYVRQVISQLLRHFRPTGGRAKKRGLRAGGAVAAGDPLKVVLNSLAHHPKKSQLLKAGQQKDQLLRSLIPLYIARHHDVAITSGTISRFWRLHGVRYAAPNAAKALREHVGYARLAKEGRQITPNGLRYVEAALAQKKAA